MREVTSDGSGLEMRVALEVLKQSLWQTLYINLDACMPALFFFIEILGIIPVFSSVSFRGKIKKNCILRYCEDTTQRDCFGFIC